MTARRTAVVLGAVLLLVTGLVSWLLSRPGTNEAGAGAPASLDSPVNASPSAAAGPPAPRVPSGVLLPNVRSDAAFDFRVEGSGAGRVLRFAASLANHGPGPLLVEPLARRDCAPGQQAVRQLLTRDANRTGRYERARDRGHRLRRSGCMLRHPTHDHWHFDAMASYALRVARTNRVVDVRRKVSFCLRDNRRVPQVTTRVRRAWFGECTARTGQGISPGWADVYGPDLDGQSLELPARLDGETLCVDLFADPRDRLLEENETDNGTSVAIRVRSDRVTRVGNRACTG